MKALLNKIHNEDCLATLRRMPNNFIDVVITSPPYNKAGYEGFIRKSHDTDNWQRRNIEYNGDANNDFLPEGEYQKQQIKVLNELHRVLKPNGSVFYNHKVRIAQHRASHPIEWLLKTKLTFRQQIVWNRKGSTAIAPIRFLPTTELIFWLTKSAVQPNFFRGDISFKGEVWDIAPSKNSFHPATMPEAIPLNILSCVKDTKEIVVYDPYAGVGTTLRVAKKLGFNYVGSEIYKEYITYFERNKR